MKLSRLSLFLLLFALSCGGGSDSSYDEDIVDMGGVWRGSVVISTAPCRIDAVDSAFDFTHAVMQHDDEVDLTDDMNLYYIGNVVGSDGFSVDAYGPAGDVGNVTCSQTYRYRYDGINHSDDNSADVRFIVLEECSDGSSCEAVYEGSALRH